MNRKNDESENRKTKRSKMVLSVRSSTDATDFLDMNDKCLVEVFKHLKLLDLCAVAEVSTRFEQNAMTCFKSSEKSDLIFSEDIKCDGDTEDQVVFKASKILRHFGAYFTKFDGEDWYIECYADYRGKQSCQRRIFELLIRYCSGTLIELKFHGLKVDDEMVLLMKPLIEGLQILELGFISTVQSFLDMLPLCSTQLRELQLRNAKHEQVLRFDGLNQPFEKLLKISLYGVPDMKNDDFEEMLKNNQQLKKLSLTNCKDVDRRIFKSISKHVPDVEFLHFSDILFEPRDVRHFGQFRNLKWLKIDPSNQPLKAKCIILLIQQIIEAKIPLRKLEVMSINFGRKDAYRFVEKVSQLKSLETLILRYLLGLLTPHFYIICKNLPQLREISLQPRFALTQFFISDIIRNANDLEWFHLTTQLGRSEKHFIDSSNFKEWAKIVANRCNKTPLEMWLCSESYNSKHTPPVKAIEGTFTLVMSNNLDAPCNIHYEEMKREIHWKCESVDSF